MKNKDSEELNKVSYDNGFEDGYNEDFGKRVDNYELRITQLQEDLKEAYKLLLKYNDAVDERFLDITKEGLEKNRLKAKAYLTALNK